MSQVDWRKPFILVLLLCVLGGTAYWLEFKQKPKKEAQEEGAKKVFALKDIPVQSVRLDAGESAKSITLLCSDFEAKQCKPGDNSKWKMTEPAQLKADDSNANALVSALNNLSASETIDLKDESPEKRAALFKDYGLDPQSRALATARKVEVHAQNGTAILYLGQTHPIGETIFAAVEKVDPGQKPSGKVDESKVYLIPTFFKSNFEHDLTYWRDKKLLTLSAHEVASFHLENSKGKLDAERKNGEWKIKSGADEYTGDIENIDNLLTGATFLNAKAFTSDQKNDAKAKAALQGLQPIIRLNLQKEAGSAKEPPAPIQLVFYQKNPPAKATGKDNQPVASPKIYATVSNLDPLFEVETFSKDRLDKGLKELRLAKLITSMERFTAKRLEFAGKPIGETPISLKNNDGKWSSQPDKTEVNADKVSALLDKLSGNRIKDFLQGSSVPSGESDGLKLTLGDDKSDTKRQLLFWKNGGKLYGRDLLSAKREAFLVDPILMDSLPWDAAFFKKATNPNPAASQPAKR